MNRNSSANKTPARIPGHSVPSRLNIGMPRTCVQAKTMTVAISERAADCINGGMSWIASLIETLLKPQLKQSPTATRTANVSSGRDEGAGGEDMTGTLIVMCFGGPSNQ